MRKMKQLNGDCLTPVSAFLRIRGENKCLLESIPREKETSRYSIIAYDPVLELQYQDENFTVTNKKTQEVQTYPVTDPLKEIEKYVLKETTRLDELPFQGGAIGYLMKILVYYLLMKSIFLLLIYYYLNDLSFLIIKKKK